MKPTPATDRLNALVRDELAAVETYRQALESVGGHAAAEDLRRIENDHERAVAMLQQEVAERGVEPATDSGAWGAWSRAVEGAAKLFGNKAALRALKEGEEHGIKDYERALKDDALDAETKSIINGELLPLTRSHIPMLERFLLGPGRGAA